MSIATGTHESVGLDASLYMYKLEMGKTVYQQYKNKKKEISTEFS